MNTEINMTVIKSAIRQSITEDLGITRDSIRAEMDDIVKTTVESQFGQQSLETIVSNAVQRIIDKKLGPQGIQFYVQAEIKKQVNEVVKHRVEDMVKQACAAIGRS